MPASVLAERHVTAAAPPPPFLTAIVTCYFEEQSIDEFYARLRAALLRSERTFEIVIVNDGSADGTWARLCALHARDDRLTLVDLVKNSGQGCAITSALSYATGAYLLFIDSDLQLDPEELPRLLPHVEAGYDVVSGVRQRRQHAWWRKAASAPANQIVRWVTGATIRDFGCTFKIYRAALVQAHEFGPRHPFNQMLLLRSTSRIGEVPVTHRARRYGRSGWTWRRLVGLNLDHLLAGTHGVFQSLGVAALALALVTFGRIALAWVFPLTILVTPPTTGLLLNALLLAAATTLGVLALVGEYVIRSYNYRFGGPRYIVREVRRARANGLGGEA